MKPARSRMRRLLRLVLLCSVIAMLLLCGALIWFSQNEARLLRTIATAFQHGTGLQLMHASDSRISIWPKPALALRDLRVQSAEDSVLLHADAASFSFPWRLLWSGETELGDIHLGPTRMNLDAVRNWIGSRPALGPPAPFTLPSLRSSSFVSSLELQRAGKSWMRFADVELTPLHANTPATLQTTFRLQGDAPPLRLALRFTPALQQGGLRADALHLDLHRWPDMQALLQVDGDVNVQPGGAWQAQGRMQQQRFPEDWWSGHGRGTALAFSAAGGGGQNSRLNLRGTLLDAELTADLEFPAPWPTASGEQDWMQALQSVRGMIDWQEAHWNDLHIEGLQWRNP
jgi:hypothetical protein